MVSWPTAAAATNLRKKDFYISLLVDPITKVFSRHHERTAFISTPQFFSIGKKVNTVAQIVISLPKKLPQSSFAYL